MNENSNLISKEIIDEISRKNGVVIFYNDHERLEVIKLIKKIKKENELVLFDNEAY